MKILFLLLLEILSASTIPAKKRDSAEAKIRSRRQFSSGWDKLGQLGIDYWCMDTDNPVTYANQCYQPETGKGTVICKAEASSEYWGIPHGVFSAAHAVDGSFAQGNDGFYKSQLELYPTLRIQLRKPDDSDFTLFDPVVKRVEIYLRCDANMIFEQAIYEVRMSVDPTDNVEAVIHAPRLKGGIFCGRTVYNIGKHGGKLTINCDPETRDKYIKEVWIQKMVIGPNSIYPTFNQNQWNSYTGKPADKTKTNFVGVSPTTLEINEVLIY